MRRGGSRKEETRGPRINHQIRVSEVRLVGDGDDQYGVVSIEEARRISDDQGLDLVEVSPNAKPPVVKLIDYGKYKYQMQKKASESKKKQAQVTLKEIQFRPNIEQHDRDVKLRKAKQFIEGGDRIKMIMQFRGREMGHKEIGLDKFKEIIKEVEAMGGTVESPPKMMGNRSITIIAPPKKK